jgi:hypothetical protein
MTKTFSEIDALFRQSIAAQLEGAVRLQSRGVWHPVLMGVLFALAMMAMGVVLSIGLTHLGSVTAAQAL